MKEKRSTAGIILAAGMARRFKKPKQLLNLNGKLLIEWVLDASIASHLAAVFLVLGHESNKILKSLDRKYINNRITTVINTKYKDGMSTSLKSGILEVMNSFPSTMFLLGDQPMIDSNTINSMIDQFDKSKKNICVPVHNGTKGNPVIFRQTMYNKLLTIKGDIGARFIIQNNPDDVYYAEIDNPLCFFDIDTAKDLEDLKTKIRNNPKF